MTNSDFYRKKIPAESIKPELAFKWNEEVLNEGFVPFPKRFLRCLSTVLTDIKELQVVLAIADCMRLEQTNYPTYKFMAHVSGFTVEEFNTVVKQLQEKNLAVIDVTSSGNKIDLTRLFEKINAATP